MILTIVFTEWLFATCHVSHFPLAPSYSLLATFKDTRETLALQIFFDLIDEEMNVKDVVSLIRDEFRAPGLEYQLRKNYRGITLNTFIIFPQDEIELKFIKKALSDDPYLFKRDGVAKIEGSFIFSRKFLT